MPNPPAKGQPNAAKPKTNAAPSSGKGAPRGSPSAAPATNEPAPMPYPMVPPIARSWGAAAPKEAWRKVRDLVGVRFHVNRVGHAVLHPKEGPNAGEDVSALVFELDDGTLFSARDSGAIGKQVGAFGMPEPGDYTIEAVASTNEAAIASATEQGRDADALLLRPVE